MERYRQEIKSLKARIVQLELEKTALQIQLDPAPIPSFTAAPTEPEDVVAGEVDSGNES